MGLRDRGAGVDVVIGRLEVDVDDGVPLGLLHAQHEAVAGDARVVDQDVDAAEIGHDPLHRRMRLRKIGGIGLISLDLDAKRLQLLDGIFDDLDIRECDGRPFGGEFQGDGFADAPGCARNQRNFSFQ